MYVFRLVARNLPRSLRRSVLTTLTVALATFIFAVLVSVPDSINQIVADASATLRLIVVNRNLPLLGMPARYCDRIRAMPGCAACVATTLWPATFLGGSDQILAVAEGLEIADVFPDYDLSGDARRALNRERRGAFAGRVLMRKYGKEPGDQITLRGTDRDQLELTFVLLGELPSKRYPNVFAFRRDYLEQVRTANGYPGADLATNLVVRVDSPEHLDTLAREIDTAFRNSDYETRTLTESDALAAGLSAVGDLRSIVLSLCAIVILTVLLIAANSAAMMVRERISEVAIMRAIGFGRPAVAAMLFGECGAIGLCGGVLGAAVALWIFGSGVVLGPFGGAGALWVVPQGAGMALVVVAATTLVSGILPIWRALRIAPATGITQIV
ncbi:MAG: ABC transporter permease [Candidatus Binatus sp.]